MKKKNTILIELILPGIFYLCGIALLVIWMVNKNYAMMINSLGLFITSMIPFILRRLKVYIPLSLEIIYFLYIFFAQLLGSCLGAYAWHPYDFILHFLFGYVGCMFGAYFLILNKSKIKPLIFLLIVGMFSMGCGAIWEIMEFCADQFLKMDTQHSTTEGLFDTMMDVVANFGGVMIFFVHYLMDKLFFKRRFFHCMYKSFSCDRELIKYE